MEKLPDKILFYDGTCGFCHKTVNLSFKLIKSKNVFFAPLQGETASYLKEKIADFPTSLNEIVYFNNGLIYNASSAFFELSKDFRFPFNIIQYFRFLPKQMSNYIYYFIAEKRHKLYPKKDVCEIPSQKMIKKLLP